MESTVKIWKTSSNIRNTTEVEIYVQHHQYSIATTKSVDSDVENQLNRNASNISLYRNSSWVICEAIHLTCIAVALYILYALLHHRALKFGNSKDANAARRRKGGLWLENLCILGIIAALCRFANNQILLFTGWTSFTRCSVLLNTSIALYFITIHPVYLFLWVRQRIFYSNRALKHLYSRTVRCLSWLALVCFVVTTILSMVLFVVDTSNSASGRVCRVSLANESKSIEESIQMQHEQGVKVNIIAGLIGGGIQLSFLALFLYPIMDNKLQAMRTKHLRSSSVALMTLIRRSFLLAGLCILSDVAIALLVKTIHTNFDEAIFAPLAMYDVNLIINLLCIIVTFRRWRVMLFPWFYSNLCADMYSCRDCCCKVVHLQTSRKYTVNYVERPMFRATSIDTVTQSAKKANSEIICERTRSQRRSRRCRPQAPVPDVMLPMLDEVESKSSSERARTTSLMADHNQNFESEVHHYSDTFLQTSCRTYERKRSTSLILPSNITAPSLKRAKSHITASLLAKSKLWIMDYKAG